MRFFRLPCRFRLPPSGGGDDLTVLPFDPVDRLRGQRFPGTDRLVDLVHDPLKQFPHFRRPSLTVKPRQSVESAQDVSDTVRMAHADDIPVRTLKVMNRDAGRVCGCIAAAFAEMEKAEKLRADDVNPAEPAVDADPGLSCILDRGLRRRSADMPGETGEHLGTAVEQKRMVERTPGPYCAGPFMPSG